MKYFSFASVIFVVLFSGCAVDVVSRTDHAKIYASATSCGDDKEQTKDDAVAELTRNYPLIAEELTAYALVKKRDLNGTVCYDAAITKRGWDRYTRALKNRQEEIIRYAEENGRVFEYNNKDVLITTLLAERRQFNQKLESAKTLAPMAIEAFILDSKSLENAVNVIPSVRINIRPCNNNRNYDCDIAFKAEVNDESKKLTYLWDFGEGSKSEEKNPTHRYTTEGSYSVSLQVTDPSGLGTFRTKDIEVSRSKNALKKDGKTGLQAYFIIDRRSYSVNEAVKFDNRSGSASAIESYLWDFGDGEKSTLRNPKHRYQKAGRYVVRYKVCSKAGGCAYASSRVVIVPGRETEKPVQKIASASKKKAGIDARMGENIQEYIARHGEPSEMVDKKKGTTKGFRFDDVWLLVKYDKVVCAVQAKGFKKTLMGQPKKCNWHRKYAADSMLELL